MSEYNPDKYVLLRVTTSNKTNYRVFGTWYGRYTSGDSWRINSGVEKVEVSGDIISFIGASGSRYNVHKEAVGASNYTASILDNLIKQAKDYETAIEIITLDTYLKEIDYDSENPA